VTVAGGAADAAVAADGAPAGSSDGSTPRMVMATLQQADWILETLFSVYATQIFTMRAFNPDPHAGGLSDSPSASPHPQLSPPSLAPSPHCHIRQLPL
jgi:hypothetical protein